MPIGYNHLTYEQRCQIETLKDRASHIEISGIIKVHRSTVYREHPSQLRYHTRLNNFGTILADVH